MNRRWERLVSAYLDGEVTPEERREVETRLRQDPDLQQLCEELAQVRRLLQNLPPREMPQELESRILQAVRGQRPRSKQTGAGRLLWAAAGAAAAVVLFSWVRGGLDRLRAAETGVHWFVWEHAARGAPGPLADRTVLQVALTDGSLVLLGEPRASEEAR